MPTLPATQQDAARFHGEVRSQALAHATALDRTMARVANARVAVFLAALAFAGATVFHRLPLWGYGLAVAAGACYGALAIWHERLLRAEARARAEADYHGRGADRLEGRWHALASTGARFAEPDHPYTQDLDVFGHGSLFQLLDECATAMGEERLARWLAAPAALSEARRRQPQVRELAGRVAFRRDLAVEGRLGRNARVDPAAFLAWAESPPSLRSVGWARPLAMGLPLLWAAVVTLTVLGKLPGEAPWLALLLPAALLGVTRRAVAASAEGLELGRGGADRLAAALGRMEQEPFEEPTLRAAVAGTTGTRPRPSRAMRRLALLANLAEQRRNQLHVVLNLLTLWDLHVFFTLDDWRRIHGRRVRGWFDVLAEVEALASLGGYLHDHPQLAFPDLAEEGPVFRAVALAHPLLDGALPNDVQLEGQGQLLLVTGSNMSGKSTLLRTMGINAVLALAGGPVCARALTLSGLHTWTSMRVQDSLEAGVSFFYAEVRRLKRVLDGAAATPRAALVLVDEMLLGTNTRERRLASEEVVHLLLATGCIGAVTTHDLSLAELTFTEGSRLHAVHFQDVLEDGAMRFDYKLRDGVVQSTNALRVLALAGIPVREEP